MIPESSLPKCSIKTRTVINASMHRTASWFHRAFLYKNKFEVTAPKGFGKIKVNDDLMTPYHARLHFFEGQLIGRQG